MTYTNKTLNSITNIQNYISKLYSQFSKNILTKIYRVERIVRTNKKIKKYYIFSIPLFKRTKKIVNYSNFLGNIEYKTIYILHKTSLSVEFVKMIMRYYSPKESAFVFISGASENFAGPLWGKNIFYGNIETLIINPNKTHKIILYGMYSQALVNYLYRHKNLLPITYWAILGGDLYLAPNDEKNNYVRKNVKAIITSFDPQEYEKRYGKKKSFNIIYKNPIARYVLNKKQLRKKNSYKILVNNCCDPSTLEVFHLLEKFKHQNIIVSTILSYKTIDAPNAYTSIMKEGKQIFQDKFEPIKQWMNSRQYADFLSTVDIYISGQNWQRGLGNMSALMIMGKKIFMKSNVSTYSQFQNMGVKVFNTDSIENMSFEEFINYDKTYIQQNRTIMSQRASEKYQIQLWKAVIDD